MSPVRSRFFRHAVACLLLLALPSLGCAYPGGEAEPPSTKLPPLELTGQIMYQLLLGEIAASRGNLPVAAGSYRDLARSTRDPRLAKRATEMSIYAREPEAALEMGQLWTVLEPESAQATQTLIGLLLAAQRLDEAAAQLSKLLSLQSEHLAEALPQLHRLLARFPDKAAVARLVAKATQPYEAMPEAQLARAQAWLAAGDAAQALAATDAALRLAPASEPSVLLKAQVLQRRSSTEAQALLAAFVDAHPKARDVRLAYARALVGERQFETARRQYQTLLEADQKDRDAAYAIALLSLQLNDLVAAEREFKALLEGDFPEANVARLYLGQIAEDSKRPQEALNWYGAVTPGDQYMAAKLRAATLTAKLSGLDAGRAVLHQAGEANPRELIAFLIAEAQLLTEAGRTADAFDLLDARLASAPEEPQLLYETAMLAEKLGRYEVLESRLRLLIRLKPEHAHAYNALGYSLAERNQRLEEAQQLIETALALAPDDAFILDSKGWVLYRRGDSEGALTALQRAYRTRADPEIAAHLGEVLWSLGRREEAETTWSAASQSDPRNEVLAATIKKFKP